MDYKKINESFYSKSYWGLDRSQNKWFSKYVKFKILKKFMEKVNKDVLYDAEEALVIMDGFLENILKKL